MTPSRDPLTYFRLKPIRSARVSEISETTAAAPVAAEDRVNFHIGNPLQDPRLSSAFLRIALGLDVQRGDLRDADPDGLLEALGWDKADKPKLEFLIRTIQKSSPYMPRGGYARKTPNAVVKAFVAWLEHQQEALRYDTGEQSARREIILGFGRRARNAARAVVGAVVVSGDHARARVVLSLRSAAGIASSSVPRRRGPPSPVAGISERGLCSTSHPDLIFEDLAPMNAPRANRSSSA